MGDDDARTIWCGGLHEQVTEDILYELFMQGGPVEKVSIPKDRDGKQKNFGFVTYKHLPSVPYALDLFDGTSLFNRTLNIKSRNNSSENNKRVNLSLMHQINMQEYKTSSAQSEVELGQQILIGNVAPMTYAPNNVFMLPPGMMCYPSQTSFHQGSKSSSADYNRGSRHQNRNHPYRDRDRDRDYYDNRQYTRDNKSHNKHSSHRSHHRHDTGRRKHH